MTVQEQIKENATKIQNIDHINISQLSDKKKYKHLMQLSELYYRHGLLLEKINRNDLAQYYFGKSTGLQEVGEFFEQ